MGRGTNATGWKTAQQEGPGTEHHKERIAVAAHRLAIKFTEVGDLPARYRNLSDPDRKLQKVKKSSKVEQQFTDHVEDWRKLIETMLSRIDEQQAWRFISLSPQLNGPISGVTENQDFCDLLDYMILRRDEQECEPEEVGGLARLSVAFQREVEKHIQS